ncbi:type II secretion system F family protein [Aldersonia sp. NBC_00410]|uniref:type II secretion system F family protein n=1 Tax=Aldersonia sp. NBC_00410 TaxID=2975954 RepID=UPI002252F567|nr:type II secretion system F family protein [Aldersonia sp. NBC_00410]MCX5043168.1 type II secretion system F family protein [Aldersonia sp. NBC_00410]
MITVALVCGAAAVLAMPRPAAQRRFAAMRTVGDEQIAIPERSVDDPLAVATAFDLLAACLRAGLPMASSSAAVARTAPAPLDESLRRASDLMTLGADPEVAWRDAAADPATESLARVARRSAKSGASLARAMDELARHRRDAEEDAAAARAERAGVLISGPLGLCFLPAFLCLGIVPVVIGLAGRVLGGGLL